MVLTFHAFCYALVRRFADTDPLAAPLRLLTAPEQEFRIRETLAGSRETRRVAWPDSLDRAFGTRAFASEVRSVVARARQLGMDPDDISTAGLEAQRPEWVAVGEFFEEYLDVLDAEQVVDYAELVHRSRILLADPEVAARLRAEIDEVFVDEYQDTDPSQVRLLQVVAGDGRNLVVVGDPDQSVYAFRGADVRGIAEFPDRFRTAAGALAPVLALGETRRFGKALLGTSRRIAERLALPGSLPAEIRSTFRSPRSAPGLPYGRAEAYTYDSVGAEADQVAELLRAAHLRDGVPWDAMAVLVRSGRAMIPGLSRALSAAGVPVEVAGDEIPLAIDPAVSPLLLGLQVAARGRTIDPDDAQVLLTSPVGGLDAMAVRRLGRALRRAERAELAGTSLPRPSAQLIATALRHPGLIADLIDDDERPELRAAAALADLLLRCERCIADGGTAEEALRVLWSGTRWPVRLQEQAAAGGESGRRANRDLDAICALFDIAHRSEEVSGLRGVAGFLAEVEGQQIPADTLGEADLRGGAVRLLSAHRSKGLEWDLVVVAGVQEGTWPDVRRRGSLLEPDRLGPHGLVEIEPTASRIAEERRLFYVACTRARRRLVVTAVAGTEGEGDQPSRFLTELGVQVVPVTGRPRRPLTLAALVAELRRTCADPESPPALRDEAALRLARLADATDEQGRPLVPTADPARWWGMRELSDAAAAVTTPETPIALSGSQLAGLLGCPRQWFLSRRGQADPPRSTAATFGSVIHVLADHGARSDVPAGELAAHLEQVWHQLSFDAKWLSSVERAEAEDALGRFVGWQAARPEMELLGTEVRFRVLVDLGSDRVQLTGSADRVERDPEGRIRIVDFKTSRSAPQSADVAVQDQMGVYQLAVLAGAFDELAGPGARPGGAELVYLRLSDGSALTAGGTLPKTFHQASLDDVPWPTDVPDDGPDPQSLPAGLDLQPTWVHRRLAVAAHLVRRERFVARVGPGCRYCPFASSCPAQPVGRQVVR
jgi:superfamily I DNA/RNA helicase/RecB family exonuclease